LANLEKLLNLLSIILFQRNYIHPGTPGRQYSFPSNSLVEVRDDQLVFLALNTLGNFDFRGHALHEIVRECALLYLDDDSPGIRSVAAITTSKLLTQDPSCYQTNAHSLRIVSEILDRLLSMAIADPDASIRITVLNHLNNHFDNHLAQANHVKTLFMALNDEIFEIREAAMKIISRLAKLNPAYVMPSLRKLLVKLLAELEYSSVR
jgi:FKBP12-rapamycin complex-associated protein